MDVAWSEPGDDAADFALLEAWRGGDRGAGERLTRRHYDRVLRFFELKAGFEAEDLTQRTFLACVQSARTAFRGTGSFRAFLFGIARRQHQDHCRRAGRREAAFGKLEGDDGRRRTSLSARFARHQEYMLLLQAMAALPDELGTVVQLYYWEGMRTAEIAAVVAAPPSTVTTRLARARQLLRESIEQLGRMRPQVRDRLLDNLEGWSTSMFADGPRAAG